MFPVVEDNFHGGVYPGPFGLTSKDYRKMFKQVKEEQKQPLLECLQLLFLLVLHEFSSALLFFFLVV